MDLNEMPKGNWQKRKDIREPKIEEIKERERRLYQLQNRAISE